MTYRVMIEYTNGYNGLEREIDTANTLGEAMEKAIAWDKSQGNMQHYIGDLTRAFVADLHGNEWIDCHGKTLQVRENGEWIKNERD